MTHSCAVSQCSVVGAGEGFRMGMFNQSRPLSTHSLLPFSINFRRSSFPKMPFPRAIPRPFLSLPLAISLTFSLPFFPCCAAFSLFSGANATDHPLMCYRGIKYFVGQEEIDDNVRCELNMVEKVVPGMEKYCYKFVSHTGITNFVKRGCSVVICSGLRNVCAKLEFEGVQGEMCCCSESSYCNASERPMRRRPFAAVLLTLFLLAFSQIGNIFCQ